MTSVAAPVAATLETVCMTSGVVVWWASATSTAAWMVGPSMTGSEYGRPTSTTSTPPSTMAVIAGVPPPTDGKAAGRDPTRHGPAGRPRARQGVGEGGHGSSFRFPRLPGASGALHLTHDSTSPKYEAAVD